MLSNYEYIIFDRMGDVTLGQMLFCIEQNQILNSGCLSSHNDEERCKMRYLV